MRNGPKPINKPPVPPKGVTSWALYDREGTHIIIQAKSAIDGEWYNMDYYDSYQSAYNALCQNLEPEDVEKFGVQILEVAKA